MLSEVAYLGNESLLNHKLLAIVGDPMASKLGTIVADLATPALDPAKHALLVEIGEGCSWFTATTSAAALAAALANNIPVVGVLASSLATVNKGEAEAMAAVVAAGGLVVALTTNATSASARTRSERSAVVASLANVVVVGCGHLYSKTYNVLEAVAAKGTPIIVAKPKVAAPTELSAIISKAKEDGTHVGLITREQVAESVHVCTTRQDLTQTLSRVLG